MNLTSTTIVQRNADISSVDMEDEIGLLNIQTGNYYALDEVGGRIWRELELPLPIGDLVERLIHDYEVGKEQCLADTLEFLQDMVETGNILIR